MKKDASNKVEARKVQRLGTSSLVVTLPKPWIRQVNLKPGDVVYIVTEGNTLRIVPGSVPTISEEPPRIRLPEFGDPSLAPKLVTCLYVLGYTRAVVELGDVDITVINRVLASASRLLGVETSCLGNNTIEMNVLIDISKIDINASIKTLTRNLTLMTESIRKLLATADPSERRKLSDDVKLIIQEIYRIQHSLMRQIVMFLSAKRTPLGVEPPLHVLLLASSLLGQAALIAARAVDYIAQSRVETGDDWIGNLALEIEEVLGRLGDALVTAESKEVSEILRRLENIDKSIQGRVVEVRDGFSSYILSKIEDFVEILRIVTLIALCGSLEKYIQESRRAAEKGR